MMQSMYSNPNNTVPEPQTHTENIPEHYSIHDKAKLIAHTNHQNSYKISIIFLPKPQG